MTRESGMIDTIDRGVRRRSPQPFTRENLARVPNVPARAQWRADRERELALWLTKRQLILNAANVKAELHINIFNQR